MLGLIAIGVSGIAFAQSTVEQVNGFVHSVWSTRDGVPGEINSMAQTPDGWIWLASKNHLYRFDGVTAEPVDIPTSDASDLRELFATSSGDLWLGYEDGLTLVLPAGNIHHPLVVHGAITGLWILLEDKQGRMWAQDQNALYRAEHRSWVRVGKESGLYGEHFGATQMDTEGTLWVMTNAGVFTLANGATRFEKKRDVPGWAGSGARPVIGHAGARLSILMAVTGKRLAPTYFESAHHPINDAQGGFWLIAMYGGIRRATSPDASSLTHLGEALSADTAPDPAVWLLLSPSHTASAMEDRQHNIWVASSLGLEQFRPSLVTTIKPIDGAGDFTLLADSEGTIWFGNASSLEHAYGWWRVGSNITPADGYNLDTTVAYRDTDGTIFLGTGSGFVRRFAEGKFEAVKPLPPSAEKGNDIFAIARDGQRKLWMSIRGSGIYRNDNGRWVLNGGFAQLPKRGAFRAVTDAHGRLWLGYPHDVFIVEGQHLTRYTREDGMDIADVRDIATQGFPLVGGDDGLAVLVEHRFHRIRAWDADALSGINGIVRLKDGTVWLNGHEGGVRIDAAEMDRAIKDPGYKVTLRVFGPDDGMPGVAQSNYPTPSLVEGSDGRLWFADTGGIAWLDPAKIPPSRSPSVVIGGIVAGDSFYLPEDLPALLPGTRSIQINYTALGLSPASKVRFRYRLSGVDNEWQDAGIRRQAFYTNLGPGTYAFRVQATNEDNIWSPAIARVDVTIKPAFYQTTWFLIFCGVLVFALLWIAYLFHLRQLTQRLHQRLEERHAERDRIARELHDTYLQTVHGLVLKVGAVSGKMPEGSARNEIVKALSLARYALAEGRSRVLALRTETVSNGNLAVAFNDVAREFDDGPIPLFSVTSTGASKTAGPLVIDELYASGREAIINAFHHAFAKKIHVGVQYHKSGIRIEIADDGKGIDPEVIKQGGTRGHWGLRGIRERMERIGGECQIRSDIAHGTTVTLFVPARRAYSHRL